MENQEKEKEETVQNKVQNKDNEKIDMKFLKELDKEIKPNDKKEYDDELMKTIEHPTIPNIPIPTFKNEKDKEEFYKKLHEDYRKKAKTYFWDYRIKRILGIRGKIDDELTDFEKNLVMKKPVFEKIAGALLGRYYMFMGVISKDGDLRIIKVPIREAYLKYKKGVYDIDNTNMLRYRGRVMNMYFEGNPHPIKYDSKINTPLVNSESLHGMFQARLVKQLFSEGVSTSTMMWSAGIVIAIGMAVVMVIASLGGVVESATKTPLLLPFIKNLWGRKK